VSFSGLRGNHKSKTCPNRIKLEGFIFNCGIIGQDSFHSSSPLGY
jgi:hypothetical protein